MHRHAPDFAPLPVDGQCALSPHDYPPVPVRESQCILISDAPSAETRQRLKILEETNDGFKIAEADLQLRGPGELLGQQQSGLPNLRFGSLAEDLNLIRLARGLVKL